MQHADQHSDAIKNSLRVVQEVRAEIFDDKVRSMGQVLVSNGKITVSLDYLPGMLSDAATRDFLVDAIGLAIKACFDAQRSTFEISI